MEPVRDARAAQGGEIADPPLRALLADTRLAWLWLIPRVSVGWVWLEAGWRHLQMQGQGHAQGPLLPAGSGDSWPVNAAAVVLTLAGIALILGAGTGLAALIGGVAAGALAPGETGALGALVFLATVAIVFTWKTAGWIGLDRWLLPLLGMPRRGGTLLDDVDIFERRHAGPAYPGGEHVGISGKAGTGTWQH